MSKDSIIIMRDISVKPSSPIELSDTRKIGARLKTAAIRFVLFW